MRRCGRLARVLPDYARQLWKGALAPALGLRRPARLTQGIVRSERGVLLAVRRSLRGWELPGGTVRVGESFEQALRREVLEETGVEVEVGRLVGVYERSGFRAHTAHVFECRPLAGRPRPSPETEQVAWFDPAQLPETIFPWFRGPLLDGLRGDPAPVERREHQGLRAILAGLRIDLRMRLVPDATSPHPVEPGGGSENATG